MRHLIIVIAALVPLLARAVDLQADLDDIALACGVTLPFAPCDPGHPTVLVTAGHDCSVDDIVPGNGRCDLAAGTYGAIRIENHGELVFASGTTTICSLTARLFVKV